MTYKSLLLLPLFLMLFTLRSTPALGATDVHRSILLNTPYKAVWGVHPEYVSDEISTDPYVSFGLFHNPTSRFVSSRDFSIALFSAPCRWVSFSCSVSLRDLVDGLISLRSKDDYEYEYFSSEREYYNYQANKYEIDVTCSSHINFWNTPDLSIDLGCFVRLPIASKFYERTCLKSNYVKVGANFDVRKHLFSLGKMKIDGTVKCGYGLHFSESRKEYCRPSYISHPKRYASNEHGVPVLILDTHRPLAHALYFCCGLHSNIMGVQCGIGYSAYLWNAKIEKSDQFLYTKSVEKKSSFTSILNPSNIFLHAVKASIGRLFPFLSTSVSLVGNIGINLPTENSRSPYSIKDNCAVGLNFGFKF